MTLDSDLSEEMKQYMQAPGCSGSDRTAADVRCEALRYMQAVATGDGQLTRGQTDPYNAARMAALPQAAVKEPAQGVGDPRSV